MPLPPLRPLPPLGISTQPPQPVTGVENLSRPVSSRNEDRNPYASQVAAGKQVARNLPPLSGKKRKASESLSSPAEEESATMHELPKQNEELRKNLMSALEKAHKNADFNPGDFAWVNVPKFELPDEESYAPPTKAQLQKFINLERDPNREPDRDYALDGEFYKLIRTIYYQEGEGHTNIMSYFSSLLEQKGIAQLLIDMADSMPSLKKSELQVATSREKKAFIEEIRKRNHSSIASQITHMSFFFQLLSNGRIPKRNVAKMAKRGGNSRKDKLKRSDQGSVDAFVDWAAKKYFQTSSNPHGMKTVYSSQAVRFLNMRQQKEKSTTLSAIAQMDDEEFDSYKMKPQDKTVLNRLREFATEKVKAEAQGNADSSTSTSAFQKEP